MSLISTYVQATDGLFYRAPLLWGNVNGQPWFVCFDDEDPAEIVYHPDLDPRQILADIGVQAEFLPWKPTKCGRMLPPEFKKVFQACSRFFYPSAPIPADRINRHSGTVKCPRGCAYYAF